MKPFWKSRTIWGAVITIVSSAVGLTAAEQAVLVEAVSQAGAVVGALLSIYGRVKAKDAIQ